MLVNKYGVYTTNKDVDINGRSYELKTCGKNGLPLYVEGSVNLKSGLKVVHPANAAVRYDTTGVFTGLSTIKVGSTKVSEAVISSDT